MRDSSEASWSDPSGADRAAADSDARTSGSLLSRSARNAPGAAEPSSAPAPARRLVALAICDSVVMYERIAEGLGASFATLSTFEQAGGPEHPRRPDVLVVDAGSSSLDNGALHCALRLRSQLSDVPILAITARPDAAGVVALFEHGVQDVLRSPFSRDELRVRAHRLAELPRRVPPSHVERALRAALAEREEARLEAVRARRFEATVLRMMAHELNTPIHALRIQVAVLERDPRVRLEPPLARGLSAMARSAARLGGLIAAVQEWANVKTGQRPLTVTQTDLETIARQAVDTLRPQALQRSVEITIDSIEDRPMWTDRKLLRVIVQEALARAIAVSRDGGVALRLERDDDQTVLQLTDIGPTIPPGERARLFEPGLQDLDRDTGQGSGLSLYVMRELAHAIDGDIELAPPASGAIGNVLRLAFRDLPQERTTARISIPPEPREPDPKQTDPRQTDPWEAGPRALPKRKGAS